MKWIAISSLVILLTACGCCNKASVVEYKRVTYTPKVVAVPAVVATPTYYDPVTVVSEDPVDVTTTTIDYY